MCKLLDYANDCHLYVLSRLKYFNRTMTVLKIDVSCPHQTYILFFSPENRTCGCEISVNQNFYLHHCCQQSNVCLRAKHTHSQ